MSFTLYRFYDSDDRLLYVGITNNPARRFSKHRDEKEWWGAVARISLDQHISREALLTAEKAAIAAESPLHNVRMNGSKELAPVTVEKTLGQPGSLEGKWFHSWIPDPEGEGEHHRAGWKVEWQGHILERIDSSYLVQLYSWWDGCEWGGARLIALGDMASWTFYASAQDMQVSLGCSERSDGRCRNPATHRTGVGNYVCWRHALFYSEAAEIA